VIAAEMTVKRYRDLVAWQKAMDPVEEVCKITKQFPREESYGLTNQLRRAAVSIPSNIAEGQSRGSREFMRFPFDRSGLVEPGIHEANGIGALYRTRRRSRPFNPWTIELD
jgi:hypothetical protein